MSATQDLENPLDAVRDLLRFLGEDPSREGLKDTPARVLRALAELTSGYREDPKVILSKRFTQDYDEMIVVRGIAFTSLCEHHLLPFQGLCHVGYLPSGQVLGLSKIARLVQCYARRLQIQERLTQEIAHALRDGLEAKGVGVIVEASHLCMTMRGVKNPGKMFTSCLLGLFRDESRSEFLRLIGV